MSKGGGQSPTGDTLLPLLEKNYKAAQGLAATPFQPYTGQLSASMPGATQAAEETARRVSGYWGQPIQAAQMSAVPDVTAAQMSAVPNVTAAQMSAVPDVSAMLGLSGIDQYMNPFTQSVIDASLGDINRQRQMSLNQGSSGAALSGAFGSDRHGVADALTNEAFGRIGAETAAGLRMGGFNTAAGLMQSDYDRALQAALANQSAGLTTSQQNAMLQQQAALANQGAGLTTAQQNAMLQQQAALANQGAGLTTGQLNAQLQQQANLANQAAGFETMRTQLAGAETLGGLGMNQYGMNQAALDAQLAEFMRQVNYPYVQQDVLNKALGMFGTMEGQWTAPSYPFGNAFAEALPGMLYGGPLLSGGYSLR